MNIVSRPDGEFTDGERLEHVKVFNLDADVFVPFLDDDLADVRLVDFLVVEAVFLLEDVLRWLDGVVVVGVPPGESELVVDAVGRFGDAPCGETDEHFGFIGRVLVGLEPLALPRLVDGEGLDVYAKFFNHVKRGVKKGPGSRRKSFLLRRIPSAFARPALPIRFF